MSQIPFSAIDSFTWSNGQATVTFHGDPGPSRYRYRWIDTGTTARTPWRSGETTDTTVSFGVGRGINIGFQVQSCNPNGCGPWDKRSIYTQ